MKSSFLQKRLRIVIISLIVILGIYSIYIAFSHYLLGNQESFYA